MDNEIKTLWWYSLKSAWLIIFIVGACLWGCPTYHVYSESKNGEAEHERAIQNRKVMIETARAENEAAISKAEAQIKMAKAHNQSVVIKAKGDAQAEIERAKGVAEANKIIGESLKSNHDYLHYLWIDAMKNGKNEKIYIPTEAGLPILEAK